MTTYRDKYINFVLDHEGGYVNNPHDPGGETNFGISQRSYPHLDIKHLTRPHAVAIYAGDFWDKYRLAELAPEVAAVMLDAAVNCGPGRAVTWLQESINELLCSPAGEKITVDGGIGQMTISAAAYCNPLRLAMSINAARLRHYCRISQQNTQFLRGWVNRVAELQAMIIKEGV